MLHEHNNCICVFNDWTHKNTLGPNCTTREHKEQMAGMTVMEDKPVLSQCVYEANK